MLAAIPSVVLGLGGSSCLGPFLAEPRRAVAPRLVSASSASSAARPAPAGCSSRALILAIMVVPIVASICRELFLSVPRELEEGAHRARCDPLGDGERRGSPSSRPGSRPLSSSASAEAIGEAIAVTQVIGAAIAIHVSLFRRRRHARAAGSPASIRAPSRNSQISARFYLAAISLVIGLLTNLAAQLIVRRFDVQRAGAALMSAVEHARTLRGDSAVRRRRYHERAGRGRLRTAARRSWLSSCSALCLPGHSVDRHSAGLSSRRACRCFGEAGGGIAPLIVGSAILVGIATAIALPIGVLHRRSS